MDQRVCFSLSKLMILLKRCMNRFTPEITSFCNYDLTLIFVEIKIFVQLLSSPHLYAKKVLQFPRSFIANHSPRYSLKCFNMWELLQHTRRSSTYINTRKSIFFARIWEEWLVFIKLKKSKTKYRIWEAKNANVNEIWKMLWSVCRIYIDCVNILASVPYV